MIDAARHLLRTAACPVAFSGAGLSAESGVPTFRDAATSGLWCTVDPMQLASPQGFDADPERVIAWYAERRRRVGSVQPNAAHRALARASIVNVTQNVDDLLQRAGAQDVIALHGTLARDRCHASCGYEENIGLADPPRTPRRCPDCGAALRPAVVWFGETLPSDAWRRAEAGCRACDVLLVIGTSAEVYPAAGLIDIAKAASATIIVINTHASAASDRADVELLGRAAEILPRVLAGRSLGPEDDA